MAGKKGRSGRKPFELTAWLDSNIRWDELFARAQAIALNPKAKAPDVLHAIGFLVDRRFGKVTQPISAPSGTSFTLKFGNDSDDS